MNVQRSESHQTFIDQSHSPPNVNLIKSILKDNLELKITGKHKYRCVKMLKELSFCVLLAFGPGDAQFSLRNLQLDRYSCWEEDWPTQGGGKIIKVSKGWYYILR